LDTKLDFFVIFYTPHNHISKVNRALFTLLMFNIYRAGMRVVLFFSSLGKNVIEDISKNVKLFLSTYTKLMYVKYASIKLA